MRRKFNIRQLIQHNPMKFGVTVLLMTATAFVGAGLMPNQNQIAVSMVCQQALLADQTLNVPRTMVTVSTNSVETTNGAPISDVGEQQMDTLVTTTYQKYFTGPLLQHKIQVLTGAIHHYKGGDIRYLGGGVDSMSFTNITIDGIHATANATAVVWTKVAQDQGNGKLVVANPHNTVLMMYTLTNQNGQWYITDEHWKFAPGSHP